MINNKTNITMKIRTCLLALATLLLSSCVQTLPLHDMTMDENFDMNKDVTFVLSQVLEIDDVNVNGIDILPHLDFFKDFRVELKTTDGKISSILIDNGNVPFMPGYQVPSGETPCYFDNTVIPNVIRLKDSGVAVASFSKGELVMVFGLDCKTVSYKYKFKAVK